MTDTSSIPSSQGNKPRPPPLFVCPKHPSCLELVKCNHCNKVICKTSLNKHEAAAVDRDGKFDGYETLDYCLNKFYGDIATLKNSVNQADQNVFNLRKNISKNEQETLKRLKEEENLIIESVKGVYRQRIKAECEAAYIVDIYGQLVKTKVEEIESIENQMKHNNANKHNVSEILGRNLKNEFQVCGTLEEMEEVIKGLPGYKDLESVVLESPDFEALEKLIQELKNYGNKSEKGL